MITQEQIIEAVNSLFEGTDKFLVEVLIQPGNRITIFFDSDNLVSIDDCKKLSRFIESRFDKDQEDYDLTVSSSGMDRPLKLPRQFQKRVGKDLEVILNTKEKLTGKLVNADDDGVEIEFPVKNPKKDLVKPNLKIKYSEIKSAKIIITIGK